MQSLWKLPYYKDSLQEKNINADRPGVVFNQWTYKNDPAILIYLCNNWSATINNLTMNKLKLSKFHLHYIMMNED